MASSLVARVLAGSFFALVPAAIMASGCLDYIPPTTSGPDGSTTPAPTTTINPDGSTTTTPPDSGAPESGVVPTGPETLVISEVRTHGTGGDGFGDDFVELYNTGDQPITLDGAWQVHQQSAQGAACQGLIVDFVGLGEVMPAHAHFLIGGFEYGMGDGAAPPDDAPLLQSTVVYSLADAGSIWLVHGSNVIDAICFYYDDTTQAALKQTCTTPYQCKGAPISNLPHDGSSGASSTVNASLARKISASGLQNTGDNSADFQVIMPATPQDLKSPAGP